MGRATHGDLTLTLTRGLGYVESRGFARPLRGENFDDVACMHGGYKLLREFTATTLGASIA